MLSLVLAFYMVQEVDVIKILLRSLLLQMVLSYYWTALILVPLDNVLSQNGWI